MVLQVSTEQCIFFKIYIYLYFFFENTKKKGTREFKLFLIT